ncbi:uncharacterized protein LOC132723134 [Ruditapes philippinarum]|uniref:uncharacterized protein LOC132723134 n=1 Tax=Ruditapes philippinarum TaxID=129788 RepID=UPI00295B9AE9|nr:uncharacterized protein LOC132723134 [Ruditapes philippinarum]
MRSGSSLTGEILQQNEHVFYVFEPLRVLSHLVKTNQPVLWFNGTRSPVTALNITSVKKQTLIGWLTCNFSLVPSQSFDDWYFLSFGKKTDVYNNCIFKHFGIRYNNHYPNSSQTSSILHIRLSAIRRGEREKCLQKLKNTCLSSKFRIVKTIRTSMILADEILTDVYGSKIIHLIRDPRSTVLSQAHYSGCPGGKRSVVACSNFHCKRVDDDTEFKQKLQTEKLARVYTTLYEQISLNPISFAKSLYNFIGMELSEVISNSVLMITSGHNITGCKVCEQSWQSRNKSNLIAKQDNYETMNSHLLSYVQSVCKNTIKYYGYEIYNVSHREFVSYNIVNVSNDKPIHV